MTYETVPPAERPLHARLAASAPPDHLVEIYESDRFLIDSLVAFLTPVLRSDGLAVVVLTAEHQAGLLDALGREAARSSSLVLFDAAEELQRFHGDDGLDAAVLDAMFDPLLAEAADAGRRVRIAGEMVALLWAHGDVSAAIELERWWNRLAERHDFGLFCAYPARAFDGDDSVAAFRRMCGLHSGVIPRESYSLADQDARDRAAAVLQQETVAAENQSSELRVRSDELERALAQRSEADQLRNEFVAMVVHDIRSPTAIIGSTLELLHTRWDDLADDRIRELLGRALHHTRHIDRLAGDMLTAAHLEAGGFAFDLQPVDLGRLVVQVVTEVTGANDRRIAVDVPEGSPLVLADADRQAQILRNLLSNAVKFSEEGTDVEVVVDHADGFVRVRVSDHGPGIPEQELPSLFRPFARLGRRPGDGTPGTGLGLYITRSLVEGQGGTIHVRSGPEGSTFTYTVPCAEPRG